jgi:prephenate dehydrogenase
LAREIVVIGAGGKMGYWFSKYFSKKGYQLSVYDSKLSSLKAVGNMVVHKTIDDCVQNADIVMLCVPVMSIPLTIEQCVPMMKKGAVLAEISSVKYQTFAALKTNCGKIMPLCIHPMFGPGKTDFNEIKMLLIPVKNKKVEIKILNDIFDNPIVKVIKNPHLHDRLIAIVLGLTHFTNTVFASFVSKQNFSYLREIGGTTFEIQSLLAASILTEEADLLVTLLVENPATKRLIQRYLRETNKFASMISNNDTLLLKTAFVQTRSLFQRDQDLKLLYKRMYHITEKIGQENKNKNN